MFKFDNESGVPINQQVDNFISYNIMSSDINMRKIVAVLLHNRAYNTFKDLSKVVLLTDMGKEFAYWEDDFGEHKEIVIAENNKIVMVANDYSNCTFSEWNLSFIEDNLFVGVDYIKCYDEENPEIIYCCIPQGDYYMTEHLVKVGRSLTVVRDAFDLTEEELENFNALMENHYDEIREEYVDPCVYYDELMSTIDKD